LKKLVEKAIICICALTNDEGPPSAASTD